MGSLKKIKDIYSYINLMGIKWFLFRVKYEILKKIKYFDFINRRILSKISKYEKFEKSIFYYKKIDLVKKDIKSDKNFIEKANNAIQGNIFAFSNQYLNYNKDNKINWHINPVTRVEAKKNLPWNSLPDFGEYGDIKLVWEASRFPQIYFFIHAYSITKNNIYKDSCLEQIDNWIEENPYPYGVNYKCGQEITFRIFSWIIALEYFNDYIPKELEEKIVKNIYTSLLRINANIDYAAKSVKNNHSISEATGLLVGGLLFPQFKESKKFIKKGLKYILNETSYQIYSDGSYIQHSFTYQRLALDVLSFLFLITEKKDFLLPDILYKRHKKMIQFLYSFIQKDGWLPNYGTNDGANLFIVDNSNYRDFRTSLKFAQGESDFFNIKKRSNYTLEKQFGFKEGGYYILKNNNIFCFTRVHNYIDRPAHNDMLHLDIWHKGENIFCDSGSYSYNINKEFKNNFIGNIGHNTLMINNTNQMEQVLNFGWSNWTKAKLINFEKDYLIANNYAYRKNFNIIHQREIKLDIKQITVKDRIKNIKNKTNIKQIWNTKLNIEKIDEYTFKVANCVVRSNIKYIVEKSYISNYYNSYTIGSRVVYETEIDKDFEIVTIFIFI